MKHYAMRMVLMAVVTMATAAHFRAQSFPAQKPSFEVASVKPSKSNQFRLGPNGDRFVAQSMRLIDLLQFAYSPCDGQSLSENQIVGAPGWVNVDRFDVEARAQAEGQVVPACQMRLMLQSLLDERFQLKAHFETPEAPLYNLIK